MIGAFLASKATPWILVGAVGLTGFLYGRDADQALDREQARAVAAELQRDQWQAEALNLRTQLAERARIDADMAKLPEARLRLCVVRGPESGCCRPAPAECAP